MLELYSNLSKKEKFKLIIAFIFPIYGIIVFLLNLRKNKIIRNRMFGCFMSGLYVSCVCICILFGSIYTSLSMNERLYVYSYEGNNYYTNAAIYLYESNEDDMFYYIESGSESYSKGYSLGGYTLSKNLTISYSFIREGTYYIKNSEYDNKHKFIYSLVSSEIVKYKFVGDKKDIEKYIKEKKLFTAIYYKEYYNDIINGKTVHVEYTYDRLASCIIGTNSNVMDNKMMFY